MRFSVRLAAVAGAVGMLVPAAVAGTTVASSAPVAARAKITSVKFSGTSARPIITIKGSGFGTRPGANPAVNPARTGKRYDSKCSLQRLMKGYDGRDYGPTALGIVWGRTRPKGYSAGVYVAKSYLDCIGLIIKKYTPREIVVAPGSQYPLYHWLRRGFHAMVVVRGTERKVTVRY